MVEAESADNVDAIADVLAVLLGDDCGVDDHFLLVGVLLEDVEAADLAPVHGCPVQDVHVAGVDNFDPVGQVRAVDQGRVVPEPRLHVVDALVQAVIVKHRTNLLLFLRKLDSMLVVILIALKIYSNFTIDLT